MVLNNTLGLAIMSLVKAYIVRPVVDINEHHLTVSGLFIKGTFLGKSMEWGNKDGGYERGKMIVTNAKTKDTYSIEGALRERDQVKRKLSNVSVWLPPAPWFTMALKHAWDNRNDGYSITPEGIPCKIFPKPKFIQGWI